jgi:pantetheine-phosphate adenylyltransferase
MTETASISGRLKQLGFSGGVLKRYEEAHRFYHTAEHLKEILARLEQDQALTDDLFLAAVYHDTVYVPWATDNEERSADLFRKDAAEAGLEAGRVEQIARWILDTRTHQPSDRSSEALIRADLQIFHEPLEKQVRYEQQIFKEYQFADYKVYQPERIKVLERWNEQGRLDGLISYVRHRRPLIGLFCGSFNPFHKGHYNILQKAERIFDKVIIAFGKNPEKNERTWPVPESLRNRQLGEYSGLLTDYVSSLGHEVVVIRGLRNSTDFDYEQNQYRYIQELMPGIKIVNIFCDKEFEHISSSGIRTLEKFNKHQNYILD